MALTALAPKHLRRFRDIGLLLVKHGRSDLVQQAGLLDVDAAEVSDETTADAEDLASDLEALGPTFVKLGQLLSTRPDLLSPPYRDALARLQDQVDPFPGEEARAVVEEELGVRVDRAFESFDPEPIAAASIGQVHRAVLRSGRTVAVKVQRPDIREKITDDLGALEEIAKLLDAHTEVGRQYEFSTIICDFRRAIMPELDFRREAENLRAVHENLRKFRHIEIPTPVSDYTTSRILTMEWVRGRKVTSLHPIVRCELDGRALVSELFRAYLQQIVVDGLFHADPHPGNIFLTDDRRLALLDLGMVCRVPREMQQRLLVLLLALAERRGADVARIAIEMSDLRDDFDRGAFDAGVQELVARTHGSDLSGLNVGEVVLSVQQVAARNGVRLPAEIRMIGKTLLNLEKTAAVLDPEFEPTEAIRSEAPRLLAQHLVRSVSPGELLGRAAELKDFIGRLPGRLNALLDVLTNNELRLNVDAVDEDRLMSGFQKVANRITVGLVLASIIVGAALMMRIETRFQLFGYPGFAIVMFCLAAVLGLGLVVSILWNDISHRQKG